MTKYTTVNDMTLLRGKVLMPLSDSVDDYAVVGINSYPDRKRYFISDNKVLCIQRMRFEIEINNKQIPMMECITWESDMTVVQFNLLLLKYEQ